MQHGKHGKDGTYAKNRQAEIHLVEKEKKKQKHGKDRQKRKKKKKTRKGYGTGYWQSTPTPDDYQVGRNKNYARNFASLVLGTDTDIDQQ